MFPVYRLYYILSCFSYSGTGKVTRLGEFLIFSGQTKFVFFEEVRHILCENCPEPNFLTPLDCFFRAWKNDNVSNTVKAGIIRTVNTVGYPLF